MGDRPNLARSAPQGAVSSPPGRQPTLGRNGEGGALPGAAYMADYPSARRCARRALWANGPLRRALYNRSRCSVIAPGRAPAIYSKIWPRSSIRGRRRIRSGARGARAPSAFGYGPSLEGATSAIRARMRFRSASAPSYAVGAAPGGAAENSTGRCRDWHRDGAADRFILRKYLFLPNPKKSDYGEIIYGVSSR